MLRFTVTSNLPNGNISQIFDHLDCFMTYFVSLFFEQNESCDQSFRFDSDLKQLYSSHCNCNNTYQYYRIFYSKKLRSQLRFIDLIERQGSQLQRSIIVDLETCTIDFQVLVSQLTSQFYQIKVF